MAEQDDILDPAHKDDGGVENVGVAGIAKPDDKTDEFKVSDDGNVAEHKGTKYIRHEALDEARRENTRLRAEFSKLEPVLGEFEEFLTAKQSRGRATGERTRESLRPEDSDYTGDELEGFAITRGYYKDDSSTPDLARAQKELDIIAGISNRQTRKAVEPVQRSTRQEAARVNRERASSRQFVDGRPVADEKYMRAALDAVGDDNLADPNVANLTQIVAAGLEYLDLRKSGGIGRSRGGRREPMMLEHGSGRYDSEGGDMSGLDLAAARARGKTPEQWSKLSKDANKERAIRTGVLEEV